MEINLTKVEYSICGNQGDAFELAANTLEYSSFLYFVHVFMGSDFCNREIDSVYSAFQMQDGAEWIDFVFGDLSRNPLFQRAKGKVFQPEVAYWIGYTYRQLAIATKTHSRDLIRIIPPEDMMHLYPGYHVLDPDDALERLIGTYHLQIPKNKE